MIYEEENKKRTVITTNVTPKLSQKYKNFYKLWERLLRDKGYLVDTSHGKFLDDLLETWYFATFVVPFKSQFFDSEDDFNE